MSASKWGKRLAVLLLVAAAIVVVFLLVQVIRGCALPGRCQ